MKLYIDGEINEYYVQTLCMIFFPGSKFSPDEQEDENTPVLHLKIERGEEEVQVRAALSLGERSSEQERTYRYKEDITRSRVEKMAVGDAIIAAGGDLLGYRPVWGMLTGVRPTKVAMEMYRAGMPKTAIKKTLTGEYFIIPKKASLLTDVAVNESKLIGTPDKKDCSMYISIPFCPSRCAYCSFVSYTSPHLLSLIPSYLERLTRDVAKSLANIREMGMHLKTIYIGGGTPTILSAEQLAALLSVIEKGCDVSSLDEFTLEAGRPDTITAEKLAVAKSFGVGRISVNPQILCDEVLQKIGRKHTTEDFLRAYDIATASGIGTINTDLIAGLPGDRFSTFAASFDKVLELRPQNITVHTFCVKKAADVLREDPRVYSIRGGDTGKCVDYSQIQAIHAGYKPYYMYRQKNTVGNFENVGLAMEGKEGLYNVYMMEEVHTIIAEGAGAVTKLVRVPAPGEESLSKQKIIRIFNDKYPYEFLRHDETEEKWAQIREFFS